MEPIARGAMYKKDITEQRNALTNGHKTEERTALAATVWPEFRESLPQAPATVLDCPVFRQLSYILSLLGGDWECLQYRLESRFTSAA